MGFSSFHLPSLLKQGEAYYKTFILNIKYKFYIAWDNIGIIAEFSIRFSFFVE